MDHQERGRLDHLDPVVSASGRPDPLAVWAPGPVHAGALLQFRI
jgi:hypothetical protein